MWYEILPSLGIVYVLITVPAFVSPACGWLFNKGKLSARFWENHNQDWHLYLRDKRLTGSEYIPRGLEGIPDKK